MRDHIHGSQGHMGHGAHAHHLHDFKRRLLVSAILTVPVLILSEMIQMWFGFSILIPYQGLVLLLVSVPIYVYGGWPFLAGLVEEIRSRQPGMMTLIGMAISVAFFYSAATVLGAFGMDFFWELATLIDVMLLGHWIEAKSVLGASMALEELARIIPTAAHLVEEGVVRDIPVSELKPGQVVLVRPGERIPSDGIVIEGESSVNESFLTGESMPVPKGAGAKVIGGGINEEGALKVRVEKTGEETYLAQVIKLVKQAQESRSRTQDLANRAAALLFYIALGVGILAYVAWSLVSDPGFAIERSVTVMVIACPHALGLAIPLVVAISTSITARSGILIRDRKAFEAIRNVDAVVFDKTGTLTEGKLGVTDVVSFTSEEELLRFTASIELNSEHMIAKAIVEHARKRNVDIPVAEDFKAIPGRGARGRVLGKEVYVGGPNLLKDLKKETADSRIKELQEGGKTVIFTLIEGELAGAFALADRIRAESYEAVRRLKEMGLKVYMITGDSENVARRVADELKVDDYFAQVLPEEKAEKVKALREAGQRVAMVGDGINDAPALVTADVGIAIGAGTDVAIESADIILVRNDPRDVIKVMELSRRTYSKMVQNIWWAAGYNIIAIPLASGVLSGLGIVLSPAVGAIVMSLSTVIVAVNAQTLRRYGPKVPKLEGKIQMVKDPVCGMELRPEEAFSRIEQNGHIIYFCSQICEEKFRQNPARYLPSVENPEAAEHKHHH
ncbi:MAG: copper-translocating P-type ATPase [Candidatus Hadarchaeum sp.]|uniref:copper-translocating P-type ATPase n=1 Tax=Candidatus Hadarchaeum sp. TaxID=2883567 RepID=UPI0031726DEC